MLCEGYIGLLSDEIQKDWKCNVKNPLEVFSEYVEISSGHALLDAGDKYFHSKRQIDWGSWLWKGNKTAIDSFIKEKHINLNDTFNLLDRLEYGILFVDSGFSGDDLYGDL